MEMDKKKEQAWRSEKSKGFMYCGSTGDSFHMLPQQMRPDSLFSPFEAALRVMPPTFLQVDDLGGHCLGSTSNGHDRGSKCQNDQCKHAHKSLCRNMNQPLFCVKLLKGTLHVQPVLLPLLPPSFCPVSAHLCVHRCIPWIQYKAEMQPTQVGSVYYIM